MTTSTKTYMIAILRNVYQPDLSGLGTVRFYHEEPNDQHHPEYYSTIEDAQEQIDMLEDDSYYTCNGEAGAPEYIIVDDDIGDYILDGRNGDLSNYDWSDCGCERGDDNDCCGECQECLEYMIDQDRQYILDNRAV
jgi:hypothetical protein